jgi:hypothetical protein
VDDGGNDHGTPVPAPGLALAELTARKYGRTDLKARQALLRQ